MRLLGWMQHKPRQIRTNPFTCFNTGNHASCFSAEPPISDHDPRKIPNFGLKKSNEEWETPCPEIEANGLDENCQNETPAVTPDLFHGFLAIGTLGSEPISSEPGTPTFPISLEDVTEEKAEVTQNDLRLINEELDKFLVAEADEEGDCNESIARGSYVSTITITGMQMEAKAAEDCVKTVACPLQGYLFGFPIELPETSTELEKEKANLGEMHHGTKYTDAIIHAEKNGKEDMQGKKVHKSAKHFIGKMFKKFHASSGNPTPSNSIKKKINEVMKMFRRKVHPVSYVPEKELKKYPEQNTDSNLQADGYIAELTHHDEKFLQELETMERNYRNSGRNLPHYASSRNGEYWIKTDADYLVLEL